MNNPPDVVALPLDLAQARITQAGFTVEIEKTYPTKPARGSGTWRVVRQLHFKEKVFLVAAEECEGIVAES